MTALALRLPVRSEPAPVVPLPVRGPLSVAPRPLLGWVVRPTADMEVHAPVPGRKTVGCGLFVHHLTLVDLAGRAAVALGVTWCARCWPVRCEGCEWPLDLLAVDGPAGPECRDCHLTSLDVDRRIGDAA